MKTPHNFSFLLKVYIIIGSILLVSIALYYNSTLIKRMRLQSEDTTQLFSKFVAIGLKEVEDADRQNFIREVQDAINLPFVLTDVDGRPLVWNEIGIPQLKDEEHYRILDFDPDRPEDPLLKEVLKYVNEFDRVNDPIKVESDKFRLLIHYGHSKLSRELAVAPYVQLGVMVAFVLFGFLGFRALKQNEQRSIWVGMAKETAHQLGTPLSSIMGWLNMIRGEVKNINCSQKLHTAIEETSADVDRMSEISARFSKIGSRPKLEYHELDAIIRKTVDYFERRRPSLKIKSTIGVELEDLPPIPCSEDLMGWVFENLIKNSLDAIASEGGKINIKGIVKRDDNMVEVEFADNGKGMDQKLRKEVFSPGVTTKARGWGLGLALVKRIVEEIHMGKIRITYSQPDKGTTFLITLPIG
jgi:two-component sensor histidine kinase